MGFSYALLTFSLVTLLSASYCHNYHNHHQEKYSTEAQTTDDAYNSTTPVLMNGFESDYLGGGLYIGYPLGGVGLLFLCCCICYRCCYGADDVTGQSTVVQAHPPSQQNPASTHIEVQQITPPPMHQQQYPPAYEMGQPQQQQWKQFQHQQQQWNQQPPVNQQFQHAPPPPYYYPDNGQHSPGSGNTAAPPRHGKF